MARGRTQAKRRYVPALDGLRAFAVLAVIAYHMNMEWAPGGLLGVTMFFVLSGYLITGLLLKEYDESGTISLPQFWLRRVRRIIPAVVFAVLGIALLCTLFNHALLAKMRPDVVPTLLFVNNWWQIVHDVSYFEALGAPSPLTHFWSLAIEEQFYLVWPVALLACMRAGVRKSTMEKGTAVLVVASALEMALLFDPHADPSRVYYGTDTRAFSLLIGALLAFVWPYQELTERAGERMAPAARATFNVVGVAAVIGLVAMVVVTNGFDPFIYRGGLLLCSLLTAVAIAVMVHPIGWIGKFFQLPPLVWVGKCSYSMYLWHYPVILLMTPTDLTGDAPWWLRLVQLVIIFAISALSYYVVENPIRHGAIGRFFADLRAGEFSLRSWTARHIAPIALAAAFVVVPIGGLALVPGTPAPTLGITPNTTIAQAASRAEMQAEATIDERRPSILVIGDSVPMGMYVYGAFDDVFSDGLCDTEIGRSFAAGRDVYASYRNMKMVGDVLVIALGTNSHAGDDEDIGALIDEIGDEQRVWFVNTRAVGDTVESTNEAIARCVAEHPNAELIDWYGVSNDHPEYFDGDGTHLTGESAYTYAWLIHDAVAPYLREGGSDDAAAGL